MLRRRVFAPLIVLEASDAFSRKQVRPGARHGGRSYCSVKVDEHLSLSRLAADPMIEVNYRLIVALHEINLDPFYTPLLKLIEGGFELVVERLPNHPQNDANPFLAGIVR